MCIINGMQILTFDDVFRGRVMVTKVVVWSVINFKMLSVNIYIYKQTFTIKN